MRVRLLFDYSNVNHTYLHRPMTKQGFIQYNKIQNFIQEIKTKVTKYLSKGNILRSTLYKGFPKIKDERVKSRI